MARKISPNKRAFNSRVRSVLLLGLMGIAVIPASALASFAPASSAPEPLAPLDREALAERWIQLRRELMIQRAVTASETEMDPREARLQWRFENAALLEEFDELARALAELSPPVRSLEARPISEDFSPEIREAIEKHQALRAEGEQVKLEAANLPEEVRRAAIEEWRQKRAREMQAVGFSPIPDRLVLSHPAREARFAQMLNASKLEPVLQAVLELRRELAIERHELERRYKDASPEERKAALRKWREDNHRWIEETNRPPPDPAGLPRPDPLP